jgi:hypothetical protein
MTWKPQIVDLKPPKDGWGKSRLRRVSDEVITDLLLHCTKPEDDSIFADKHALSIAYVRQIRLGRLPKYARTIQRGLQNES